MESLAFVREYQLLRDYLRLRPSHTVFKQKQRCQKRMTKNVKHIFSNFRSSYPQKKHSARVNNYWRVLQRTFSSQDVFVVIFKTLVYFQVAANSVHATIFDSIIGAMLRIYFCHLSYSSGLSSLY